MIAATVHWFSIGLTCHVENELRNDGLKTQVLKETRWRGFVHTVVHKVAPNLQGVLSILQTKSLISHLFLAQFIKVRGVLELSGPQLSKSPLTISQGYILRG